MPSNGALVGDAVLADLRAIPAVLEAVVGKWRDGVFAAGSLNRRAAAAFADKLKRSLTLEAEDKAHGRAVGDKLHLLVVGIEVSLFVAEQFAADVMEFLPGINAKAVSSNQLVGGDKVPQRQPLFDMLLKHITRFCWWFGIQYVPSDFVLQFDFKLVTPQKTVLV